MRYREALKFLKEHKMFEYKGESQFKKCVCIEKVMVSPKSKRIVKDSTKNTLVQYWLEAGGWLSPQEISEASGRGRSKEDAEQLRKEILEAHPNGRSQHDIDLDCSGNTRYEAIINLAKLIQKKDRKVSVREKKEFQKSKSKKGDSRQ